MVNEYVTENNRFGCCPTIFLHVYQFWSVYLNIYMNGVTFSAKTPQIFNNSV